MKAKTTDEQLALRVTVLHDVSLLLNCAENCSDLLFGLVRHFRIVMPVDYAALLIRDQGAFLTVASVNENEENSYVEPEQTNIPAVPKPDAIMPGDFLTEMVALSEENRGELPEHLQCLLTAPLFRSKEFVGMLLFGAKQPDAFSRQDQALVFQIGLQIAAILKNFLLRSELQAVNRQLEMIFTNTEEGFLLLENSGRIITMNAPVWDRFFEEDPPETGELFMHYLLSRRRRYRMGQWMHHIKELQEKGVHALPLLLDLRTEAEEPVSQIRLEFQALPHQGRLPRILCVLRDRSETSRADALKRDLTMMLVHDLRSPLGIINWNLEMLLDGVVGELTEKQQKILQGSIHNSQELLDMIDSLLDIDRLETGALELELSSIDCYSMIEDLAERMNFLAEQLEISVVTSIPVGIPELEADMSLIRRILFNLVFNAAKYSPPGSVVTVGVTHETASESLRFFVADMGPGIPDKYRQTIFDKYVQAEARNRGEIKSKGLGLAFCKLAVEAHGGRIWVEQNKQQGSVFLFTVPVSRQGYFISSDGDL